MQSIRAALFASAVALGGCTTDLHTRSLQSSHDPQTELPAGFVYHLPAAVVTPAASISIDECTLDTAGAAILGSALPAGEPAPIAAAKFVMSGDITVDQVPGQPVLIDYRELASFLKTSSIGIERHPNLMLKSVNVSVEDQTPQLIANLATIAADAVLVSTGAPPLAQTAHQESVTSGLAAPRTVSYLACTPKTAHLLVARDAAVKIRDDATVKLQEITAALEALMRNADTGFTQGEIAQIHLYRDEIVKQNAAIADATATLADIAPQLALKLRDKEDGACRGSSSVVARLDCNQPVRLEADDDAVAAFVNRHFVVRTAQVSGAAATAFENRTCMADEPVRCPDKAAVTEKVRGLNGAVLTGVRQLPPRDGKTPIFEAARQTTHSGSIHPSQGIIYVEPARFDLVLKQAAGNDGRPPRQLKSVTASIAQLGTYIGLPVRTGFGEKAELKATFNTDGSLATASYSKPVAGAVALTGALAGLADKGLATQDALADRRLKLLKAKADVLTQQQAIADAQAKLHPKDDPLADIKAQIAIAEANAALAEANARIRIANGK